MKSSRCYILSTLYECKAHEILYINAIFLNYRGSNSKTPTYIDIKVIY